MGRKQRGAGILLAIMLASTVCVFALDPSLDVSQYAHTSWKTSEGFSKGTIWAIAQTPDGYLWLATEFGLLRFDGVRAVEWQPPAGEHLPNTDIRNLLAARDGTLWIGTGKGLVSWKAGKLTHYPDFDRHDITALLQDREGTVWVAGKIWGSSQPGKVCAFHSDGVQCFGSDGRFGSSVTALYEDSRGNLWLGAANGLWRLKPGPPQHYPIPGFKADDVLFPKRAFLEDSQGELLITGPRGIRRFIDGKFSPYPLPSGAPQIKYGKLLLDRDGGLWIGTWDTGLLHVHQGRMDVFAEPDGLSNSSVENLFEDREGDIWIAGTDGIERFRDYAVSNISAKQGLSSPVVASVLAAQDGSVWVGTSDGLNRLKDGQITIYRKPTAVVGPPRNSPAIGAGAIIREIKTRGLPGNSIASLYQEPGGRLWVSAAGGLAYFEDGRFIPARGVHFSPSVTRDGAGNLWMTSGQWLYRWSGGRVTESFPSAKLGLRGDIATLLAVDRLHGGIWVASWVGGLVYFKDGQIRASYGAADGLGDGRVNALEFDSDSTLWAATETGLSRVSDGRVETLSSKNGLPCNDVHGFVQDDEHSFWMDMPCGLVRVTRSELDAWIADPKRQIQTTVFDTSDGLEDLKAVHEYAPRIAKAADGKVWFVARTGVSVIDPRHLPFNKLPPPVHIEQITADGETYWQNSSGDTSPSHPRLPPLVRDLTIDYTALSLVAPEKVRFRFKLTGQDREWREVAGQRRVEYSNLPPGNYHFRVIACNNSGVWNESGDSLEFSIAPAYYQTNLFRALCMLTFLGIIWTVYQFRVRALERRQVEIRALNEQLVKGQEAERMRIAGDLHDGILQQITSLTLRLAAVKYELPSVSEAKAKINELQQELIQIGTDVRHVSHELHPAMLQESGLPTALSSYCEEFSKVRGLNVSCETDESVKDLSPGAALCLYRIAQEALGNAAKYSEARKVEVLLTRSDGLVCLSVSDDGVGCSLEQIGRSGGLGLINMRERVIHMDGRFEFESAPGWGTTVRVAVPYRAKR